MADPAPRVIPRRAVVSWVLYDLANTIFSMGVVSLYFPLYIRGDVGAQRADSVYGVITAISMGMIFIISPLLGAMTDRAPRRMPFLVWSTILCCAATALIARGSYLESATLFVIGNAAYQAGLQFYDALLPEVTTEENRGRIGGIGVGVGYLGSYLAVGIGLLFGTKDKPFLFLIIAVAFMVFALPCFLFVKERGNPNPRPVFGLQMIREAYHWRAMRLYAQQLNTSIVSTCGGMLTANCTAWRPPATSDELCAIAVDLPYNSTSPILAAKPVRHGRNGSAANALSYFANIRP